VAAAHPEQKLVALVAAAEKGSGPFGHPLLPESRDGDPDPLGW
jgi:hypothetical protein